MYKITSGPVRLILLMIIGFVIGLTIVYFLWTKLMHPEPGYLVLTPLLIHSKSLP